MKRRPESVDAHIVLVSPGHLSTWETMLPAPSVRSRSPQNELVRSPLTPPSWTQSPHAGSSPAVVNSGQFASTYDWLPPLSSVRPTCSSPLYIVPETFDAIRYTRWM